MTGTRASVRTNSSPGRGRPSSPGRVSDEPGREEEPADGGDPAARGRRYLVRGEPGARERVPGRPECLYGQGVLLLPVRDGPLREVLPGLRQTIHSLQLTPGRDGGPACHRPGPGPVQHRHLGEPSRGLPPAARYRALTYPHPAHIREVDNYKRGADECSRPMTLKRCPEQCR